MASRIHFTEHVSVILDQMKRLNWSSKIDISIHFNHGRLSLWLSLMSETPTQHCNNMDFQNMINGGLWKSQNTPSHCLFVLQGSSSTDKDKKVERIIVNLTSVECGQGLSIGPHQSWTQLWLGPRVRRWYSPPRIRGLNQGILTRLELHCMLKKRNFTRVLPFQLDYGCGKVFFSDWDFDSDPGSDVMLNTSYPGSESGFFDMTPLLKIRKILEFFNSKVTMHAWGMAFSSNWDSGVMWYSTPHILGLNLSLALRNIRSTSFAVRFKSEKELDNRIHYNRISN